MKTLKTFLNENQIDEAMMHHVKSLPVGSIIHPYDGSSGHRAPHTVVKKLASKTVIKDSSNGEELNVSHATGAVKDSSGAIKKYSYKGFSTPEEKATEDERKNNQREKNTAHSAITAKLEGMRNSFGHTVGTLSDEDHATILHHLEKLRANK